MDTILTILSIAVSVITAFNGLTAPPVRNGRTVNHNYSKEI